MCCTHSFGLLFAAAQLLQQLTKDDMRGMSWLHFDTPVKKATVQEAVLVGVFKLMHSLLEIDKQFPYNLASIWACPRIF